MPASPNTARTHVADQVQPFILTFPFLWQHNESLSRDVAEEKCFAAMLPPPPPPPPRLPSCTSTWSGEVESLQLFAAAEKLQNAHGQVSIDQSPYGTFLAPCWINDSIKDSCYSAGQRAACSVMPRCVIKLSMSVFTILVKDYTSVRPRGWNISLLLWASWQRHHDILNLHRSEDQCSSWRLVWHSKQLRLLSSV